MATSPPKVSVLMAVYNGCQYLRESVESILSQTFSDFEFIIINDCSTDESWAILKEYASLDKRIKLFENEENIGLTKSLNKGLSLAQGEYIARQDADDISLPKRFVKQVNTLDKNQITVLVSCNLDTINANGITIGKLQRSCDPKAVRWYLLFGNHLGGHSQVMFRHRSVLDLGSYDETYRYSQDYELRSRLSKIEQIEIVSETLQKQRKHSSSVSIGNASKQTKYALT